MVCGTVYRTGEKMKKQKKRNSRSNPFRIAGIILLLSIVFVSAGFYAAQEVRADDPWAYEPGETFVQTEPQVSDTDGATLPLETEVQESPDIWVTNDGIVTENAVEPADSVLNQENKKARAARAYLAVVQEHELDIRMLQAAADRDPEGDCDIIGVVVANFFGDETPELIYPTVIEEYGEYSIGKMYTGNYTYRVTMHVAAYDEITDTVRDLLTGEDIFISQSGQIAADSFTTRWTYYKDMEGGGVYYICPRNLTGNALEGIEYVFNPQTFSLEQSYAVDWGAGGGIAVEDIQNPALRAIAEGTANVNRILTGTGKTDFLNMTYEEGMEYLLQMLSQGSNADPVGINEEIVSVQQDSDDVW